MYGKFQYVHDSFWLSSEEMFMPRVFMGETELSIDTSDKLGNTTCSAFLEFNKFSNACRPSNIEDWFRIHYLRTFSAHI